MQRKGGVYTDGDSSCSGSPRSSVTLSDRGLPTQEDDGGIFEVAKDLGRPGEEIEMEDVNKQSPKKNTFEFSSETGFKSARRRREAEQIAAFKDDFDKVALFKDFTEPDLMKTGYLIPLTTGHNGQFNIEEKTLYEVHLTAAGFIQDTTG